MSTPYDNERPPSRGQAQNSNQSTDHWQQGHQPRNSTHRRSNSLLGRGSPFDTGAFRKRHREEARSSSQHNGNNNRQGAPGAAPINQYSNNRNNKYWSQSSARQRDNRGNDGESSNNFVVDTSRYNRRNKKGDADKIENQQDDEDTKTWGPKRTRPDSVPGGPILKRIRPEEFNYDDNHVLYCNLCNKGFRTLEEKVSHDSSRSHIKERDIVQAELIDKERRGREEELAAQEQQQRLKYKHHQHHQHIRQPVHRNPARTQNHPDINNHHQIDNRHYRPPIDPRSSRHPRTDSYNHYSAPVRVSDHPPASRAPSLPPQSTLSADAANNPSAIVTANNENKSKEVADVDKLIREETLTFENTNIPDSFKTWANISLQRAQETANNNKDPRHLELVRKEISFELARSKRHCTLYRINWGRLKYSTGSLMDALEKSYSTEGKSVSNGMLIPLIPKYSLTHLHELEVRAEDKENYHVKEKDGGCLSMDTYRTRASNTHVENEVPGTSSIGPSDNDSITNPSETAVTTTRSITDGVAIDNGSVNHSVPAAVSGPLPAGTVGANSAEVRKRFSRKKLLLRTKRPSKLTARAERLSCAMMEISIDAVLKWKVDELVREDELKQTREKTEDKEKVKTIIPDIEPYIKRFREVDQRIQSAVYEYEETLKELRDVIKFLDNVGKRPWIVQRCLQHEVDITIERRDFANVPEPARKLMQSYINYGSVEAEDDNVNFSVSRVGAQEYVALYLLSLLIREKRTQPPRGNVSMNEAHILNSHLLLNEGFRRFPDKSLRNSVVFEMKNAFSALISNNWVRFFSLFQSAHVETMYRSRAMMVTYVSIVRERAMMTMFSFGVGTKILAFHPNALDLNFVMDSLGFMKYERHQFSRIEDSVDCECDAALLMIRKLKTGVAVESSVKEEESSVKEEVQEVDLATEGGNSLAASGRHNINVRGSNETSAIADSKIVNVPLLIRLTGNKVKVVS